MNVTYRPIGHDWPGKRTSAFMRTRSRFESHGRFETVDGVYKRVGGGKVPWNETLALLDRELNHLAAKKLVFQLDIPESDIRLDGMPSARARIADPAVIVSFDSKHGPLRYFCDQFADWHDNIRAIALGLEALRKVERYGITHKGEQYAGWKQLPQGSGQAEGIVYRLVSEEAAAIFMLTMSGHLLSDQQDGGALVTAVIKDKICRDQIFKIAAQRVHPDKGGRRADWDTLTEARRMLESATPS